MKKLDLLLEWFWCSCAAATTSTATYVRACSHYTPYMQRYFVFWFGIWLRIDQHIYMSKVFGNVYQPISASRLKHKYKQPNQNWLEWMAERKIHSTDGEEEEVDNSNDRPSQKLESLCVSLYLHIERSISCFRFSVCIADCGGVQIMVNVKRMLYTTTKTTPHELCLLTLN